jgi:hypothetical protein
MNSKKSELAIDLNLLNQDNVVDCTSQDELEHNRKDFHRIEKERPSERTQNHVENIPSAYVVTNPCVQPVSECLK